MNNIFCKLVHVMCALLYSSIALPQLHNLLLYLSCHSIKRCIYQSAAVLAVRRAYEYHRHRSGRFFFMVHHHTSQQHLHPLPPRE